MQLYRGMDIGTAKLPLDERRGIPHHQLDVLDVTQEATVAAYQQAARADLAAIAAPGPPRRCSSAVPASTCGLRSTGSTSRRPTPRCGPRLEADGRAPRCGGAAPPPARERIREAAAQILPGNVRRVVRALEVIEITGRPFSASMPTREFVAPAVMLGLRVDRAVLDERIGRRVERMWEAGLRAETEALLERGLREGVTASRAIGYSQAIAVVDGVPGRDAGASRHRPGDPPLRPPPGVLVPPGPAHLLARRDSDGDRARVLDDALRVLQAADTGCTRHAGLRSMARSHGQPKT